MKKPTREELKDFFKTYFNENPSDEHFEKAADAFYARFYQEDKDKPNPDIMVIL
jgi:hypothetical protein